MRGAVVLCRAALCVCLASVLVAGCSREAVHRPDRTPPASMVALMLTPSDVPAGSSLTAQNNIVQTTGCPQADPFLNQMVSHTPETDDTTVIINAGDIEVMQTLVLDMIESEPNQRFHSIASVISSCDGGTFEAPYQAMPTSPPTRSESFTLTPADELPEGVTGYTSTVTAGDGAQRTFQRIYVPVKDKEGKTGLIALTTATAGSQPASLTPLDLLDTAVQRANVTIDHAALAVPYPEVPVYQPTTSQPSAEPAEPSAP